MNVNGGETVFFHHSLGQQDRVFKVVTVPRHESHPHVLAQGQFAHVGGWSIRHDVATLNYVPLLHQRTLVDAGVLVGAGVFDQVVDINPGLTSLNLVIMHAHNNAAGINRLDNTTTTGHFTHARVMCHVALDTGADQRLVGTQGRYGLALHVGAHKGTVGIVMLKERNQ